MGGARAPPLIPWSLAAHAEGAALDTSDSETLVSWLLRRRSAEVVRRCVSNHSGGSRATTGVQGTTGAQGLPGAGAGTPSSRHPGGAC